MQKMRSFRILRQIGRYVCRQVGRKVCIHSSKSLMILERMVNQNAEDEIFQDFKVGRQVCYVGMQVDSIIVLTRGRLPSLVFMYMYVWYVCMYVCIQYWEDASDAFREGEGSLLPLWRFTTERAKRKQVGRQLGRQIGRYVCICHHVYSERASWPDTMPTYIHTYIHNRSQPYVGTLVTMIYSR